MQLHFLKFSRQSNTLFDQICRAGEFFAILSLEILLPYVLKYREGEMNNRYNELRILFCFICMYE